MYRWTKTENLDSKKVFKNISTYAVLVAALGAMTFFGVCSPNGPQIGLPGGKAATVADWEISSSLFRRNYQYLYEQYQRQMKDNFDPSKINLSQRVLDDLVSQFALFAEADKSGIFTSQDEVAAMLLKADGFQNKEGQFDVGLFDNYLRANGLTEKSLEAEIMRSITSDKTNRLFQESTLVSQGAIEWDYRGRETKYDVEYLKFDPASLPVVVSEQEIKEYLAKEENAKKVSSHFESNKSLYNKAKSVHARHILISFAGARDATGEAAKRSKEEAKSQANLILAGLKDGTIKDFSAAAKDKTDDPSGKANGGDLGFFKFEDMVPEFSKVAFELKVGEISDAIESPFGFHIIKVEGIQEAVSKTLADVEATIAKEQISKEKGPLFAIETANTILALLKENKDTAEALKKASAAWASTGDFSPTSSYIAGIGSHDGAREAVFSLTKPGQLFEGLVDIKGVQYILRLKKIEVADPSKLTAPMRKELEDAKKYYDAMSAHNIFSKWVRDRYQETGLIWLNDQFLNFSANRNPAGA